MNGVELVIFDIAGTLIEDHDEVTGAFLEALQNNSISASEEEIKEWKGGSKREVIAHFVERQSGKGSYPPFPKEGKDAAPQDLIDRTYRDFRFQLERRYQPDAIVPIAGTEAMLHALRQRGLKLATTTGFYREVRGKILAALNWEHLFDANVCSDDVAHGRPAPEMILRAMQLTSTADPERVATIGDTPLDLQSGTRAGCGWVIGVLTGKHTTERLQREPHTHLIPSVAQLSSVLDGTL